MNTALSTPSPSVTRTLRPSPAIAFAVLLVALAARLAFAAWEQYAGSVTYDELHGFGGAYWPLNLLVFGPAYAIGFVAQAFLVWQLGRGRARGLTGAGGAFLLGGGVVFALAGTAHALPFDWAANHGILPEATGRDVVAAFDGAGTPMLVPYLVGTQALIALGALATVVGARLSRTIPTWLLVATLVVLAAIAVPIPFGSVGRILVSSAQAVLWAMLGWFGWRAGRLA